MNDPLIGVGRILQLDRFGSEAAIQGSFPQFQTEWPLRVGSCRQARCITMVCFGSKAAGEMGF
jgi:hypothetical protein